MRAICLGITSKCNQQCAFCFYKKQVQERVNHKLIQIISDSYKEGSRSIVFTGGEPFLKEGIFDLAKFAISTGYTLLQFQTNGLWLSESKNIDAIKRLISPRAELRFLISVHGHNAETHEFHTNTKDSFKKLIKTFDLLDDLPVYKSTNTVVTKRNIEYLDDIVKLLKAYTFLKIQFSILNFPSRHDISKYAPTLLEFSDAIRKVIENNESMSDVIKTQGIPFCLMKGLEKNNGEVYLPSKFKLEMGKSVATYDFKQQAGNARIKKEYCKKCLFDDVCYGVWEEYKKDFYAIDTAPIC